MSRTRETGVTEARHQLAEIVSRVAFQGDRVLLKRHGRARVAMIPIEDFRLLEALENELDLRALRAAFADPANAKPIAWDDIKAELGLKPSPEGEGTVAHRDSASRSR